MLKEFYKHTSFLGQGSCTYLVLVRMTFLMPTSYFLSKLDELTC